MDMSNYSLSDIRAATEGEHTGWGDGAGGGWFWIVVLFLFMFGFGGNGGWGNNNAAAQGALTRADLCQDMNFQQLENSVRGVQSGLCNGFYSQNTTMLNGLNGIQRDLCTGFSTVNQGFNSVNQNINESRFASQQCCCETNRNIDAVRTDNYKNTCDIVNAIRTDGETTRALINQNTMQELRDKLEAKDRSLLSANFQLSQQAQNAYLVNQLKPCPIPAYLTASPYASYPFGTAGLATLANAELLNLAGRNNGGCCGQFA